MKNEIKMDASHPEPQWLHNTESAKAPAGGHTPEPLQFIERFDARMWPAQSGWGPMNQQDIESIHESLPELRRIINSYAALLAERDRLRALLQAVANYIQLTHWEQKDSLLAGYMQQVRATLAKGGK